jgi:phosphoribosylglycinamide formyltransferase-1
MIKKRVGVLLSGRGSNFQALIDAQAQPGCAYDIVVALSNTPDAFGLERARNAGIPAICVDHRPFKKDRAAFEAAMHDALKPFNPDLLALAGFMRVLTPWFVGQWRGRMINIHPSLLPLFPGLDTHQRALDAGMRVHGCSVHWVSEGVDEGAIIGQGVVPIAPGDDATRLAARVITAEHALYPACLNAVCGAPSDTATDTMLIQVFA